MKAQKLGKRVDRDPAVIEAEAAIESELSKLDPDTQRTLADLVTFTYRSAIVRAAAKR